VGVAVLVDRLLRFERHGFNILPPEQLPRVDLLWTVWRHQVLDETLAVHEASAMAPRLLGCQGRNLGHGALLLIVRESVDAGPGDDGQVVPLLHLDI
jgi:hypothetical protein